MTSAKQIYLGVRRGSSTPPLPYDAEVKYLESTGTQYIITGVRPQVGDVFSVDTTVQYSANVVSDTWLTGWYVGSGNSSIIGTYQNQIYFTYNTDGNVAKTKVGLYDKHRIRYNFPDGILIDDIVLSSSVAANTPLTVIPISSTYNGLCIFNRFNSYGFPETTIIKAKVFSFQIIINGSVSFDGIPVRFTNEQGVSEGAMYDRVSGQLFRNAGRGEFWFGTDIAGGGING